MLKHSYLLSNIDTLKFWIKLENTDVRKRMSVREFVMFETQPSVSNMLNNYRSGKILILSQ